MYKEKWQLNEQRHAYLVSLDICEYSKRPAPDGLLDARADLQNIIDTTVLFANASKHRQVKIGYLGDQFLLAFPHQIGASNVKTFIDTVFDKLEESNGKKLNNYQTWTKGIILEGPVKWTEWRGCSFIDGPLPFKCREWDKMLKRKEVVIDAAFRNSLQTAGIPVLDLHQIPLNNELGYMLRGGEVL